ncbi:hypothetical protein [Terrabacter sp. NPDC000476]|uniref:hypothetical protein n=1 Tax=Terrabacter sp. NPDC000476 TaxID=3154258 RepID=UPI003333F6F8
MTVMSSRRWRCGGLGAEGDPDAVGIAQHFDVFVGLTLHGQAPASSSGVQGLSSGGQDR